MSKPLHRLFALLALLVVGHAQVFGLARKYVCFYHDVAYVTDADHHHRGTGLDSRHFDHFVPHTHDHETPGDTEKHLPVRVELTALQCTGSSVAAPAVMLVALLDLPEFLAAALAMPSWVEDSSAIAPDSRGTAPPGSVQVVRSTVFLV